MSALLKQQQPQQMVALFQLQNGERVPIPESMFIYCVFLRNYKMGMLKDRENMENFVIPLPNILPGLQVSKQHLTTMVQFFDVYTRHTFGAGSSSAKKVSSSIDLQKFGNLNAAGQKVGNPSVTKQQNFKQKEAVEAVSSGTDLTEIEAKSNAKTPGLPDWAHGFFSALDKDLLIGTANVANYLLATPFVEHLSNFLALKCREMDSSREIMEFLNDSEAEDMEGEELRELVYGGNKGKGQNNEENGGEDGEEEEGNEGKKQQMTMMGDGGKTESSISRETSGDTQTGGNESA